MISFDRSIASLYVASLFVLLSLTVSVKAELVSLARAYDASSLAPQNMDAREQASYASSTGAATRATRAIYPYDLTSISANSVGRDVGVAGTAGGSPASATTFNYDLPPPFADVATPEYAYLVPQALANSAAFPPVPDVLRYKLPAGLPSAVVRGPPVAEFATILVPKRTVIGKWDPATNDIKGIQPGENSLLKHLPDQGSPKLNWRQNSKVLRTEMNKGLPLRDAHVDSAGRLLPGSPDGVSKFIDAERNLLRNRGWTYDPKTTLWSPSSAK